MPDTTDPIVTEDTSTPYVDAVKAYMEENNISTESNAAEESVPSTHNELLNEDPTAPAEETTEEDKHITDMNVTLQTDTAFIEDELDRMQNLSNVVVKGFEYKISQDEKEAYLKAMLNNKPVVLTIRTAAGKINITCRSLSVYEIELATNAGIQFVETHPNSAEAEIRWRSEIQKYRLTMQMVKINSELLDTLSFSPEPGKVQEHIKLLRERATQIFSNMNVVRWRCAIHALNIFEYKLNRMNELALMPDFLSPDELD